MTRVLVTDLDNTLYDWVGFFAPAFDAMVKELASVLRVPERQIRAEYREEARHLGTVEHPFTTLLLPSVRSAYPGFTIAELRVRLDPVFHAFNRIRKSELTLYPTVGDTLVELGRRGVRILGYTESTEENAWFRLFRLHIGRLFSALYVLEGPELVIEHDPATVVPPPAGFVRVVPRSDRKPNPQLLLDIARLEGIDPAAIVYVGDSLTRDVLMAKNAGSIAVWARYGANPDPAKWRTLLEITHWDQGQVNAGPPELGPIEPDLAIDSYSELLPLFGYEGPLGVGSS